MRRGKVLWQGIEAGLVWEDDQGYWFQYIPDYLAMRESVSISLTLPLRVEPFRSEVLFPFFDGLIPEGWLLEVAERTWKVNPRDRMGLLLTFCQDCIGAVSVHPADA